MLAPANGEKIVCTDKLICEVLNSAPAPVLPELLAARHQAGLAIFDATGRYRPSDKPYLNWPGKAPTCTVDCHLEASSHRYRAFCLFMALMITTMITTKSLRVIAGTAQRAVLGGCLLKGGTRPYRS